MREILFRGKRTDNGEWVYGNYYIAEKLDKSGVEYFIIEIEAEGSQYYVIPETVGQYTGLEDKNGKKIFEGDILKFTDADGRDVYLNVVFENGAFLIEEDGVINSDLMPSYDCLGVEVIGNIYDNPELLKGCEQE